MKRHPSVVSNICGSRAKADALFGITKGARLMLSTPQAMMRSPSPHMMALAPSMMASSPLAHNRFTVTPATEGGKPASSAAIRATLRLSSPLWFAAPAITSSMAFMSTLLFRRTRSLITRASRSSGRILLSAPPYLPMGVRTASII